jgi:hypothetical protein
VTETDKVVREGTAHFGGGRKVLDPFDDVARDPFRDAGSVGANDEAHVRVFGGFQERAAASPFVVVVGAAASAHTIEPLLATPPGTPSFNEWGTD